ncbi:Sensory transduction protein LytR [bacterium HR33]|nr:Sensory transduction protein LytR [bacterium HR33]
MVRSEGKVIFVKVESIDWIQSAGNYAKLHVGKQIYTVRSTMNQLERMLDPRRFGRIHRSAIVNFDRIKEMQPWFSGDWLVILHDGTRLRLSRSYRSSLQSKLGS